MQETLSRVVRAPLTVLQEFLRDEAAGGLILIGTAALGLLIANSPASALYFETLHVRLGPLDLSHWISDGLMAVFFLLVGLEVKRELLQGELSSWRQRALPGVAALGGLALPAAIYIAVNASDPERLQGWAIPTATDIAFALGVLTVLGRRVPSSLKLFLAALAIIDDLAAILMIALFYAADPNLQALGLAVLALAALAGLNQLNVQKLAPYVVVGAGLWACLLWSGVHATLAGVALAFAVPLRTPKRDGAEAPLLRLEHGLNPWVAFGILPLFAFANAGVSFSGFSPAEVLEPVTFGTAAALFFGKQLGVFGAAWLAIRTGLAKLPDGVRWSHLYGVALLCGIGFTMSLFIGSLAFEEGTLQDAAKVGTMAGSLLSALVGAFVLSRAGSSRSSW